MATSPSAPHAPIAISTERGIHARCRQRHLLSQVKGWVLPKSQKVTQATPSRPFDCVSELRAQARAGMGRGLLTGDGKKR